MILTGKVASVGISTIGFAMMAAAPSFNLAEFGLTAAILGVVLYIHYSTLKALTQEVIAFKVEQTKTNEKMNTMISEIKDLEKKIEKTNK